MLKRAGCDYWPDVKIQYYDSFDELTESFPEGTFYFIETVGSRTYSSVDYSRTDEDLFFVFGKETKGIPQELIDRYADTCLKIPQNDLIRSLNLSNTAAIIIYEVLRQQNFQQLT